MKLLPKQQPRVNTEDSVGLGIEAAVIIALFLGLGYVLDRIFGTMPIFMIVMTVVGAVGLFAKLKYRYDDRMDELEAERRRHPRQAPTASGRSPDMNTPAAGADAFTTRFDGPAPEVAVSKDMIKRGLIAAPALIAACAVIWGADGAMSSAYAHRHRAHQLRARRGADRRRRRGSRSA